MKKIAIIISALLLFVVGTPNIYAAQNDAAVPHPDKISANISTTASQDAGTTTTNDHVITRQRSRDVFNDTFDRKDPVSRFVLDRGYGHLEIYVKNKGNSTITFSLVHTDSGKQYITKRVGAGGELSWKSLDSFSQGLRSGNYEIQWRAGGDVVRVSTWGVSGQYPKDIS
ncbi:hypothetical protein [Paenibacillus terrae]|uniref:Uncharacterized protein n=1 Tax=Paenibacillus terrae TaxID=159743 RepID=A0A0D7X7P3_9BACL|nr:hypothetical protein [Paenibacillus terrae]KJD47431.1 hypothetical protein QD47_00280 [Paenibacillus terrae]